LLEVAVKAFFLINNSYDKNNIKRSNMHESDKDDPCDDVSGKNALEGWIKASENTTKKKKKIERDYPPYPGIEPEDNE
jgi:hypothetical protein|tara:strand:+ start:686 stop:919 length:234 start_codon:yes stop_codon:yes gene_type:complete